MLKDWRGTPIEVGSYITYPWASGHSIHIRDAEIIEIKAEDVKRVRYDYNQKGPDGRPKRIEYDDVDYRVKVEWYENNWQTKQPERHTSWLTKAIANITVLQKY